MSTLSVSIIMPARNAAPTIAASVRAVLAQTVPDWELLVIDDGSTDETAAVVERVAAGDPRVRVVQGEASGVSAARNVGIAAAAHAWLLFLDADDTVAPTFLERLTGVLAADPTAELVACGWADVTPDGTRIAEHTVDPDRDLFGTLIDKCAFAIHTVIVRRDLVRAIGGFDTTLVTCEDWDVWQRIARRRSRIVVIPDILAFYVMRPGSASRNAARLLADGIRVIGQGHRPDPRVADPDPAYANGLPPHRLPSRRLYMAVWVASLILGGGVDARSVLATIEGDADPDLDPESVATLLFEATMLQSCRPRQAWPSVWPGVEPHLDAFLAALERQSGAALLARRTRVVLERRIAEAADLSEPITVGGTHAICVEITRPIPTTVVDAAVERLWCRVEVEGQRLGAVSLPVCDGRVPASVLADAIAAEYAWHLLGRFLKRAVYDGLYADTRDAKARRRALGLDDADAPAAGDGPAASAALHDRTGWTTLLQEVWGLPDWPSGRFYDGAARERSASSIAAPSGPLPIEISDPLPNITGAGRGVDVAVAIGGAALGIVRVPADKGTVSGQRLRADLTLATGMELCRLAVREGIIGQPLATGTPLRARLVERARARRTSTMLPPVPADIATPGTTILARRAPGPTATSADRRAMLPGAALAVLKDAAAAADEAVREVPGDGTATVRIAYAPDLRASGERDQTAPTVIAPPAAANLLDGVPHATSEIYGRQYFEALFAEDADPWKYTSDYEQLKYEQTLSLFPAKPVEAALELACAEGHFTIQMSPRVKRLVAADISQIALDRTAARCRERGLANIQFAHLDFFKDEIPGQYDLIVCSEVLYYTANRETLKSVARKMAAALKPGGRIIMAHGNAVEDEAGGAGFDWGLPFGSRMIGEVFAATAPLRLSHEIRTPLYRVQAFERVGTAASLVNRVVPRRVREAIGAPSPTLERVPHAANLPPDVAAHARQGGVAADRKRVIVSVSMTTDRLPILMYHRVADSGVPALDRYRVTPAGLEEQLRYLRDAGYVGVTLAAWHAAMTARKPLPGRAVLLTFDDGYLDFHTNAWPLLKRYGFPATMFLVADRIGEVSAWDAAHGEPAPLMGWPDILQLQAEGVEFGAHTCTHPPLTGLTPAAVTVEAARARAILTRGLGRPVPAFAYPYGDQDAVVRHLTGACGFTYGLTCEGRLSELTDDPLALPRLEITGTDTLATFMAKLAR